MMTYLMEKDKKGSLKIWTPAALKQAKMTSSSLEKISKKVTGNLPVPGDS